MRVKIKQQPRPRRTTSCSWNALCISLLSGTLAPAGAFADVLELADGSRLVGKLVRMETEYVLFQTSFSGELSIARKAVTGLETDAPVVVSLADGSRLVGNLRNAPGEGQRIATRLVGEVPLEPAQITALWEPDAKAPEVVAMEKAQREHALQVEELQAARRSADDVWTGAAAIGIAGSDGNTRKNNMNGSIQAKRTTEFDRLTLGLQGRTASEQGKQTEAEVIATAGLERDFTERWFAFGDASFERDRFEDIDLRAIFTSGVGYFVLKKPWQEWKPKLGLGYQFEAFESTPNEGSFVLSMGYEYWVTMAGRTKFGHNLTYLPSIEDPGKDYRVISEATLKYPLSADEAWNLQFSLKHQFDGLVPPGVKDLDTHYKVNIGYDFD